MNSNSFFDEEFDYTAALRDARADRRTKAQERLKTAMAGYVHDVERRARIAAARVKQAGGDEADACEAAAAIWETGTDPSQAAVTGSAAQPNAQPQAVPAPDVIDEQVAGLEGDLHQAREDNRRLQEDYGRLQADYRTLEQENERNAASARRVSDYLAQRDEANRLLDVANQEKRQLEAELNEARRQRDEAKNQLNAERRNARQTQQPAPAQQPSGRHTGISQGNQPTPAQGNQPAPAQASQSPQPQRPANQPAPAPAAQQPQQTPAAPAATPAQPADPTPTRAMPTQPPAQPQAQQPRQQREPWFPRNRGNRNN